MSGQLCFCKIGLASSCGYYRQHGPLPSGMGSRSGPSSCFKEEDDLNSEDAEVLSGGTDVASHSSTQLVYAVFGVVELFLDRVSAQWTSRLVAVLGTAQQAQPAALTAFLDR